MEAQDIPLKLQYYHKQLIQPDINICLEVHGMLRPGIRNFVQMLTCCLRSLRLLVFFLQPERIKDAIK